MWNIEHTNGHFTKPLNPNSLCFDHRLFRTQGRGSGGHKNKRQHSLFIHHLKVNFFVGRACAIVPLRKGTPRFGPHWRWALHLLPFPCRPFALVLWLVSVLVQSFSLLGFLPWMPPTATDLQRYTITQLLQTLISIGFELAKRFRVQIPIAPPEDDTQIFHCTAVCHWCTCTCVRTSTTHRTHQCQRHLGFWICFHLTGVFQLKQNGK